MVSSHRILFTMLTLTIIGSFAYADTRERSLVGYASDLTARPGDTLEFKVSVIGGGQYQADLVRIVNGDSHSRYAEKFAVESIAAKFAGKYEGTEQQLNLGSYIHVESVSALDKLQSFTVGAWIFPSFDPTAYEPPDLENPDPFYPPTLNIAPLILDAGQTIVSRFDAAGQTGWALRIDANFRLEFAAGNGKDELRRVTLSEPLKSWDWAYVAASYDADSGEVTVHLREMPYAPGDQLTARSLSATGNIGAVPQAGPLRIAAARGGPGAAAARLEKPIDVFTGRLQDVRIAKRVLDAAELDAAAAEVVPKQLAKSIVADWDFGRDISTLDIRDVSGNSQDGVVVNLAERAVRGRYWDGSTVVWMDEPDDYDAIKFHADDLYDAEWRSDFTYTVPDGMASGIYAARLQNGGQPEYITFWVAPPKGKANADVAVWLSDYNYLAYSNITLPSTVPGNYPGQNLNPVDAEFYKQQLNYGTGGVYNMHIDGTYFIYGSRLRPDLQMKPTGYVYNFPADTHIAAFLEHEGIAYDIISDELVDTEGGDVLNRYRLVISSTHHEYVTAQMVDDVAAYTAQGGRFFYIGGNGWFWSVDGHPVLPGVMESRNFSDIGDRYLTSGQRGGLMVETGRRTGPIFGNEMGGMIFHGSSPYRKLEAAADPRASWIFAGTNEGKVFGDYGIDRVHGGAAGFEIDRYNAGNGVPRHALHLATSEPLRKTVEDVKLSTMPLSIIYHPNKGEPWAQADLVFFETPNGGAMFSTGSITWISSTLENNFNNDVATVTRNVIRRFIDKTPFPNPAAADVGRPDRAPRNPEYDVPIPPRD
ncbi:MAG: N,N-dimethylformamidase beta subunit family domain-containing protein [Gammaproteobacteria bacterium]